MEIKKSIVARIGVVYAVTFLVALAILGQVLYIQNVNADMWKEEAASMSQKHEIIPAMRGNILARDLSPLASSLPRYNVTMDPNSSAIDPEQYKKLLPELCKGLSRLWPDKTAEQYNQMITKVKNSGKHYVLIHRDATFEEARRVRELPLFSLGQFKGGLVLERVSKRERPYDMLAARTIGYLSKSETGTVVGIEGAFDHRLKGSDGTRMVERIGGGTWVPLSTENEVDPKDGFDVVTTLNVNYQDVAHKALHDCLVELKAEHGCAVLMEVATGEILAMANLGFASEGQYVEKMNYAIAECAEPGSTFKLPAIMAALEDGFVTPSTMIDTYSGKFTLHNQQITDSHAGGYGLIPVQEVIEKSSNIGMARLIEQHYRSDPQHFLDRLYGMGINKPLGIEIDGYVEPRIKTMTSSTWSKGTLPWMAFGYEVEMTPLQILTFYNAIANNGKMMKPMLVRELKSNSQTVQTFAPEVLQASICSEKTLRAVRLMLEGVVLNGTAKNLKNDLYPIAGKTGTAVMSQGAKGYRTEGGQKNYRASFVGYFPADRPRYSCIVVVTKPSTGTYYGNVVAGGVFKAIADKVYATNLSLQVALTEPRDSVINRIPFVNPGSVKDLSFLLGKLNIPYAGVKREDPWTTALRQENRLQLEPVAPEPDRFPNLLGMGIRDVLPILENMGYKVRVKGSGKIYSQSPAPGTSRDSVGIVELQLSVL